MVLPRFVQRSLCTLLGPAVGLAGLPAAGCPPNTTTSYSLPPAVFPPAACSVQVRFQLERAQEGLQRQLVHAEGGIGVLEARLADANSGRWCQRGCWPAAICVPAFASPA